MLDKSFFNFSRCLVNTAYLISNLWKSWLPNSIPQEKIHSTQIGFREDFPTVDSNSFKIHKALIPWTKTQRPTTRSDLLCLLMRTKPASIVLCFLLSREYEEEAQIVNGEFDQALLKQCSTEAQDSCRGPKVLAWSLKAYLPVSAVYLFYCYIEPPSWKLHPSEDLVKGLLRMNPDDRLTPEQVLAHPFLRWAKMRKNHMGDWFVFIWPTVIPSAGQSVFGDWARGERVAARAFGQIVGPWCQESECVWENGFLLRQSLAFIPNEWLEFQVDSFGRMLNEHFVKVLGACHTPATLGRSEIRDRCLLQNLLFCYYVLVKGNLPTKNAYGIRTRCWCGDSCLRLVLTLKPWTQGLLVPWHIKTYQIIRFNIALLLLEICWALFVTQDSTSIFPYLASTSVVFENALWRRNVVFLSWGFLIRVVKWFYVSVKYWAHFPFILGCSSPFPWQCVPCKFQIYHKFCTLRDLDIYVICTSRHQNWL